MDVRIVNICNNNCLYCLESALRLKEKFVPKRIIFEKIVKSNDKNLYFFGGNPLLHPDLEEIIYLSKLSGKQNIGILSNSFSLNQKKIEILQKVGLTNFGLYFHSFNKEKQKIITGDGISYEELLQNLTLLSHSKLQLKIIIHINGLNIIDVYQTVLVLHKKFGINTFDFVNYFPFDKPYFYRSVLEYDIEKSQKYIKKLFLVLEKYKISGKFYKFPRKFFGRFEEFYDFEAGVLRQIGDEDKEILHGKKIPFCYNENRCKYCFLQDNCKFYEK